MTMGIVEGFFTGVIDSLKGIKITYELSRESFSKSKKESDNVIKAGQESSQTETSNVVIKIWKCCLYNFIICALSYMAFYSFLLPGLHSFIIFVNGEEWGNFTWNIVNLISTILYFTLWVLPLFLIGRVVNTLWFMEIANSAFRVRNGRPRSMGIVQFASDMCVTFLIQVLFMGQQWLLNFTPWFYVKVALSIIHNSIIISLYAFEYKWYNLGWGLNVRLHFIENNWPYFLGFGFILSVVTEIPESRFVSICIFSTIFPLIILSSNESVPVKGTSTFPFKIFSLVIFLSNCVLSKTYQAPQRPSSAMSRQSSVQPSPQTSRNTTPRPTPPPSSSCSAADEIMRTRRSNSHYQHHHQQQQQAVLEQTQRRSTRRMHME